MNDTSMDHTLPNFASTEIKEDNNHDKSPNALPRTVLRSNKHLLLDGEWRFDWDEHDHGLVEGWHLHHNFRHTAKWPGSVEEHIAKAHGQPNTKVWQDKVVVWYERTFELPRRPEEFSHLMYQLTFGACGYETRVWLNGIPLRTIEGEEVHFGEYTSFSYELNDSLLLPVNRLTVRIADTMDSDLTRGKQESHVYKRGGIWYQTYTGAVRSVWLETVERNRLRSRIGVVSLVEDQLVRFNFTTRIHDPGQYTLRLNIYEYHQTKGTPLATSDYPLLLEAGQKNQRVVIEVPNAKLWGPDEPHLYQLVAQLIDSNGYSAEIQAHFGLRKIEARGRFIYLNNKQIYLDGILYQPGTATYEEMRGHMLAMKKLGCNLVRVHIAGVDPRIYNLADELGLLLWVEVPSPHSSTHQSRKNHWEELQRMLALIETNPSIVLWSLYNEDWGAQDIASNAKTRQYIIDTYHYMAIHHPQFLVVDNDGWRHISLEGRLKSDLLTAHIYTPELERWKEVLGNLSRGDLDNVAVHPLVIGDPFFYRGQVPIVVSEWGGFGFADYGGPSDNEDRATKIRAFKDELRKHKIAGDIYTQATNIEDEKNGLIDFHTAEIWVEEGLLCSRQKGKWF
jgi:beta-galactosidase/beta-glucuronidase